MYEKGGNAGGSTNESCMLLLYCLPLDGDAMFLFD